MCELLGVTKHYMSALETLAFTELRTEGSIDGLVHKGGSRGLEESVFLSLSTDEVRNDFSRWRSGDLKLRNSPAIKGVCDTIIHNHLVLEWKKYCVFLFLKYIYTTWSVYKSVKLH